MQKHDWMWISTNWQNPSDPQPPSTRTNQFNISEFLQIFLPFMLPMKMNLRLSYLPQKTPLSSQLPPGPLLFPLSLSANLFPSLSSTRFLAFFYHKVFFTKTTWSHHSSSPLPVKIVTSISHFLTIFGWSHRIVLFVFLVYSWNKKYHQRWRWL